MLMGTDGLFNEYQEVLKKGGGGGGGGGGERDRLIGRISMLNEGCLWLFRNMTQKVPGSYPEVSHDSTKPMKIIIEQENNFRKYFLKHYSHMKLLKDTFV